MDLTAILHAAQQQSASDVHLDASSIHAYIRIHGHLKLLSDFRFDASEMTDWVSQHINDAQNLVLTEKRPFDFSYIDIKLNLRTRVSVYFSKRGLSLAIRLLPSDIPSLSDIGVPDFLLSLSPFSHGLVLLTGPTGSGKSTTLASYLHHINQHYAAHVVTLEDPIEYIHLNQKSLFHQTQKPDHFEDYAEALNQSLRRDPDVIVIGELRELASIEMALRAAETGHLVIATLHSSDATTAITRLIDVFSAASQNFVRQVVSSVLLGVVAQRLVEYTDKDSDTGRVATFEMLIINAAAKNLISDGQEHQLLNLMQTHLRQGMFTFAQHQQKLIEALPISVGI